MKWQTAVLGLAALLCGGDGLALTLAEHAATAYHIVNLRPDNAINDYAARELATHLRRMTGAEFPIVPLEEAILAPETPRIAIGGDAADYADQEYHIFTADRQLHLTGGGSHGALYAVYDFLAVELGCRWYTLREDGVVIPERDTLELPELNRRGKADFAVRHFTNYYLPPTPGVMDFFARNQFNVSVRLPEAVPERLPFIGPTVHSLHFYISPEATPAQDYYRPWPSTVGLFATHPEYFSMDASGRRVTGMQLCFSNPEMRKLFTKHLLEMLATVDGHGVVEVSANDVPQQFCHCPPCRALTEQYGSVGGPLYDYLLEAAPEIAAVYPDAYLKTLAYRKEQTEVPPRIAHFPDNVIVVFAPIDADFAQPLDHPSNADTLRNLHGWCAISSQVWLWYYVNPYGEGGTAPLGNIGKLARDIRTIRDAGVVGALFQHDVGVAEGLGFAEMQSWILSQLFQDADRDENALIVEFTDFYYGSAAPVVRDYLAELEACRAGMKTPLTWCPAFDTLTYLTPEFLARQQRRFDELEASENSAAGLEHVKMLRVYLDIATLNRWREIRDAGLALSFDLPTLVERIKREQTAAVQRTTPSRPAPDPAAIEQALSTAILLAEAEVKPLPELFAQLDQRRVRQFFPLQNLVDDADAAIGKSARLAIGEVPLTMGVYDGVKRQWILSKSLTAAEFRPGYHWYEVGTTRVTPDCLFWLTQSWFATVPLARLYVEGYPDKQWKVYVSLKLDGPGYGQTGPADTVSFDRLVLVEQ